MPFQSEKQRRYLHANHPEIAKRWEKEYAHGGILDITGDEEITTDDGNDIELTAFNAAFDDPNDFSTGVKSLFRAKNGGMTIQGGVDNWLGEQVEVTVPKYWKSQPGAPETELAYITKAEKELLLKKDLHGSLKDGPNIGPNGVMSLDSAGGSYGSPGSGTGRDSPGGVGYGDGPKDPVAPPAVREKQRKDLVEKGPGSDWEKYSDYSAKEASELGGYTDTKRGQLYSTRTGIELEEAQKIQREKLKKMGLSKLVMPAIMILAGVPINVALKSITVNPKDLMTAVKHSIPVMQAKKEHLKALDEYKTALLGQVDVLNPNEMKSKIGTTISDITNEIKELTKTEEDDTGDDGPQVVPIHEEIQEYEQMASRPFALSNWATMKQKQALNAQLQAEAERQKLAKEEAYKEAGLIADNPIVLNKGGLANLFRVKNQ